MDVIYQLKTPDFVDPFWLRDIQHGQEGIVSEAGVEVRGVTLRFRLVDREPKSVSPPAGTRVRVSLTRQGFLVCAELAQLEAAKAAAEIASQAERAKEATANIANLNRKRQEADAANALLHVPVRWTSGIKDVLSGLSARSWGDGRSKSTVEHILLEEDLVDGNLVRRAGDFLCTTEKGTNGRRWSGTPAEQGIDGAGQHYIKKVTCKACLRIAKKWQEP